MNAVEIRNLTKSFRGLRAVDGLNMTVPQGAIYGFIGENGSGKSTTEKLICGHLVPDCGKITLFGRPHLDAGVRIRVGALIENAGCFPSSSVYANLKMHAINLGIAGDGEIDRVLKIVKMDGEKKLKFKNCSLGMKQRVGIAMALLGEPKLLILDEPINGLDTDGMRLMREILVDITKNLGCTVLISSHILGELEKIATHYGVIRRGKMIREISAAQMEGMARTYIGVKTDDDCAAANILRGRYGNVALENGQIAVYGEDDGKAVSALLIENGFKIYELGGHKVGLEEYYISLMSKQEADYE